MKKPSITLQIALVVLTAALSLAACKKLNESTTIGSDLLPEVDNITTFDTILTVEAYNQLFDATDSLRFIPGQINLLGKISNDPIFGETDARMFFELKSSIYKTYPFFRNDINNADSISLDSVVLVLDYQGTYGDTLTTQTVEVYELDQMPAKPFRTDSLYLVREEHFAYSSLLGSRSFQPKVLKDSVKAFNDSTAANQLRIKLNDNFGKRLIGYDTAGVNGAYASDSAFKTYFKGFALKSTSGNALMSFDLLGNDSRLAVYFKYKPKGGGAKDTTVQYFTFTPSSAVAQYIKRDYSAGEIASRLGGTAPDDLVYIQNAPGTYTNIKIPALNGLSNRVVHRAELYMEQVSHPLDTLFGIPTALYLDAYDSSITAPYKPYRTIPYSLLINEGGPNFFELGCFPTRKLDGTSGKTISEWRFNITRYVQNLLNGKVPLYDLRLWSPYDFITKYQPYPGFTDQVFPFPALNTVLGVGRVRLGGGTHATQKMKIRLVYSKL